MTWTEYMNKLTTAQMDKIATKTGFFINGQWNMEKAEAFEKACAEYLKAA